MKTKTTMGLMVVLAGVLSLHAGTNPGWWTESIGDKKVIDPSLQLPSTNFAPANLGQLKHMALQAKRYLDRDLASVGGAGAGVNARVGEFYDIANNAPIVVTGVTNNKAPANLGQLKHIAKPFYDRLIALGVDTRAMLRSHGAPTWEYHYPWTPETTDDVNKAIANLGQLKWVFCFSMSELNAIDGADGQEANGVPDWWEKYYYGHAGVVFITTGITLLDSDGDGLEDLAEYHLGTNPISADSVIANVVYDAEGKVMEYRNSVGVIESITYDADGNIKSLIAK
jgi:YD repeat-containing protein